MDAGAGDVIAVRRGRGVIFTRRRHGVSAGNGFTPPTGIHQALSCLVLGQSCGGYQLPAGPSPDLRGLMTWSINWDRFFGWEFLLAVAAADLDIHFSLKPSDQRAEHDDAGGRCFDTELVVRGVRASLPGLLQDHDTREVVPAGQRR